MGKSLFKITCSLFFVFLIVCFIRVGFGKNFIFDYNNFMSLFLSMPNFGQQVFSDIEFFGNVFDNISTSFGNITNITTFFNAIGSLGGFFQGVFSLLVDIIKVPISIVLWFFKLVLI